MLAVDVVLFTETEDDLQRFLHCFNIAAKLLNIMLNTNQAKYVTISRDPIRCKLEFDSKIIQLMNFNYLEADISSDKTYQEVNTQITKVVRISGCMEDVIFCNCYM